MTLTLEDNHYARELPKRALIRLQEIADKAVDIDDAANQLRDAFGAATIFRGGNHVAFHRSWRGQFLNGIENRLALITA